jgi:hypothetical protein
MKKKLVLLILSFLFLISCAPKVSYTEEFPYLPSYKGMVAETEGANKDQKNKVQEQATGLKKVTYIVEGVVLENALTEYETILHENGWKTIYDGKPNMIKLQKEKHTVNIVAYQQNKKVKLDITSNE